MAEDLARESYPGFPGTSASFGQSYRTSAPQGNPSFWNKPPPPYTSYTPFNQPITLPTAGTYNNMTRTQTRSEIRAMREGSMAESTITTNHSSANDAGFTTAAAAALPNSQSRRQRRQRKKRPSNSFSDVPENNKGRTLMKDWLRQQVDSGQIEGLRWENKERTVVRIPWRHASRHGWELNNDACLFMRWAKHTGKYEEGRDATNAKKWKANFRCALNSLPGIRELSDQTKKTGPDAFKIYEFTSSSKTRPSTKEENIKKEVPQTRHSLRSSTRLTVMPSKSKSMQQAAAAAASRESQEVEEDLNVDLHMDIPQDDTPQYVLPSCSTVTVRSSPSIFSTSSSTSSSTSDDSLKNALEHSYALTPANSVIPTVVENHEKFDGEHNELTQLHTSGTSSAYSPPSPSDDGSHTDSGFEDGDCILIPDMEVLADMDQTEAVHKFCIALLGAHGADEASSFNDTMSAIHNELTSLTAPVITQTTQGFQDSSYLPTAWPAEV